MPGKKTKAKAKTSVAGSPDDQLHSFIGDIPSADGWTPVIDILCNHLDLPERPSTRNGLKRVHANFENIYGRLEKTYTRSASDVRVKGGIAGIYARMCVDSILRTMLFRKGFLKQIFPLLEIPSCRHLALRSLTTITHHVISALVACLKDFADDPKVVELAIITISHCFIAALCDDGVKMDPGLARSFDHLDVVKTVTEALHKPSLSRVMVDHSVQLLAASTIHCKIPFGCTTPMKLMACASKPAPPHLNEILRAYGFEKCELTIIMKTSLDYQRAMIASVQSHDLYSLGLSLASFITRTEFSISDGMFETENPVTGRREILDSGLPFKLWGDALPHCAKAIRDRGFPKQVDLADILDMKYHIMRQRIPEAVKIANVALARNPGLAYAYYALSLAADTRDGLRAAKKGMKCADITPFLRFQMMQRAVEHAGEMGIQMVQDASGADDKKWVEGIAFLASALEDSKAYIAGAPPDNRHMKNMLYWYILLRITMEEDISADLAGYQGFIRRLKIADDFSNWVGVPPPKTVFRLTQQTVVKLFPEAAEEWDDFMTNLGTDQPSPLPSAEKAEDDLAVWLGDMDLEDGQRAEHFQPARFNNGEIALYRCSWCGNPSVALRKCAGCSKTRYCDASCQRLHWKEHKKACVADDKVSK
ncbi:hypothetical protein B0H16DRAFT_1677160 [Mycena metata]|uniref:MYND-type domain-containing protein n=1 Tax=Mycena metata TaxID=1033252 RepID=A0AAD7HUZ9_9AGAR|nr:hypothetical protein B0H16DRAFT_1677160 [Mycena metata]